MSITQYSRYRRMKLTLAWELAGMAVWCREVGKYIAAFVLTLICVQYVTDKAIAEDEAYAAKHQAEQRAAKAEETWISCLNHKGVYINDSLHTCSLADTRLAKGDF